MLIFFYFQTNFQSFFFRFRQRYKFYSCWILWIFRHLSKTLTFDFVFSNLTSFRKLFVKIVLLTIKYLRRRKTLFANVDWNVRRAIDDIENFDFDKSNSSYNINRQTSIEIEIEKQNDFRTIEKIRFWRSFYLLKNCLLINLLFLLIFVLIMSKKRLTTKSR